MKKILYISTTILSLTGFITCLFLKGSFYNFNSQNVKNNIAYLSSDRFKGRLTGSDENYAIANEIEETFKSYNLKPLTSSFKESFTTTVPIYTNKECKMKISNNDEIIKEFIPGSDFKEDMLNFKNPSIHFTKEDTIEIYQKSIVITKDNTRYLFCVSSDKNFPFRSSFISQSSYGFAIQITTNTYNDILNSLRNGYTLDINLPYKLEEREVYNIAGKIEGTSKNLPPLVITAHYDHVGFDSLNNVYSGALDNASGTAFMLELARTYSSLKVPKRDIIFVALNAEEFGLLGSKAFATDFKDELSDAEVINFDMIGIDNFPVTFMRGQNDENKCSELLEDLQYLCKLKDIKNNVTYQDSSDHASFCDLGIDSLTVSHADTSNIHTPKDTVDLISTDAIDTVYKLIDGKVLDYAYSSTWLILYNSNTLIFFSLSSFALCGFGIIHLKNKRNKAS